MADNNNSLTMLRLELFGGYRALLDQQPLEGFVSNKVRALFAYLAVSGKPQPRQVLAEMFWGDKSDTVANTNLRVALSNLRSIVAPYVQIGRHEVSVAPGAPLVLDVAEFRRRMERNSPRGHEIDSSLIEEALVLYQGDLLDGFMVRDAQSFDEWALWQRERLRLMALQGLQNLSGHYTERGDYPKALNFAHRLLELEPWQEEGHRQMMLLLALSGNRGAALAQYETCRRILASELNTQPLPETNALLERIKAMPRSSLAPAKALSKHSLFGRDNEYAWLLRQWRQVTERRCQITLIEGEMGIGKTRLVEEALRQVGEGSGLVLRARCHQFDQNLPLQPVADLLRQAFNRHSELKHLVAPVWLPHLASILPEVYELPTAVNGEAHNYGGSLSTLHSFEAVNQTLRALASLAKTPLVIFLDDLHWVDGATVDLLRYLLHRLSERPIWLVGAYQQDGIEPGHPFLSLRSALIAEDRAKVLRLERLPRSAIANWISTAPSVAESQREQVTEVIMQRGQGNPFITSQILRDLSSAAAPGRLGVESRAAGNGQPAVAEWQWQWQARQIPFAVREIVLLKLNQLSPAARGLLSEAAALGEPFDAQTLAWIDPGQPATELLNECLEKGLITVVQPGVFRFVHPMTREIAAEWLTPWRRQRIGSLFGRTEAVQADAPPPAPALAGRRLINLRK